METKIYKELEGLLQKNIEEMDPEKQHEHLEKIIKLARKLDKAAKQYRVFSQ